MWGHDFGCGTAAGGKCTCGLSQDPHAPQDALYFCIIFMICILLLLCAYYFGG